MSDQSSENPKRSGRGFLVVLLILSIAANAWLAYEWYNNNYRDGRSLADINAELQSVLDETEYSRDSLQEQLDLLNQQYTSIYDEMEALRTERTEALEELGRKKVRIRQLLAQVGGNPKALVEAKGEIERLEKELNDYRQKLDIAQGDREKFEKLIDEERAKREEIQKEKTEIVEEKEELEDKVKDATFQISDLSVKPLRNRRKKQELTFKHNKVDEIEISFTILESPLVEEGEKELLLRLIGTNQEVLGANNDLLTDSDKLFSKKKDFVYDGTEQSFKFKYTQDEAYKTGSHTAELWCDGKMITRTPFNLE